MAAMPSHIIEPILEQFAALLPEREVDHPLGCHRLRVPERAVFERLVQVLVFGDHFAPPARRVDLRRGNGPASGGHELRQLHRRSFMVLKAYWLRGDHAS